MLIICNLLVDGCTTGMQKRRPVTLIADEVIEQIQGKRKGYQIVIGKGYSLADFATDIADGSIKIKADQVVLMIGNNVPNLSSKINMGNRVAKVVQEIQAKRAKAKIWVCSLFPRILEEEQMIPSIKKANTSISTMCRKKEKFSAWKIKYVPVHCQFLEQWKHYDCESKKMQMSTRIVRPVTRYFVPGANILNIDGVERALAAVERAMQGKERDQQQKSMERQRLLVEIDNTPSTEVQVHIPFEIAPESMDQVDPENAQTGAKGKITVSREGKKGVVPVRSLIDKWEMLSQATNTDCLPDPLDVELGEDSIVQVNLGDQELAGNE